MERGESSRDGGGRGPGGGVVCRDLWMKAVEAGDAADAAHVDGSSGRARLRAGIPFFVVTIACLARSACRPRGCVLGRLHNAEFDSWTEIRNGRGGRTQRRGQT